MFDTNTLVAACLPTHPHHEPCRLWLNAAVTGRMEFVVACHALAEAYRVLTAMNHRPPLSPQDIWQVLDANVVQHAALISVNDVEYLNCLRRVASQGYRSGIIYDALIVEAAMKANVDKLLTLNDKHFQRVWPNYADQVINPQTTQVP